MHHMKLSCMDVERGGTLPASAGAIKKEQDPDEHAQANTHNGAKKKKARVSFLSVLLAVMSHKSTLSFESFIFTGMVGFKRPFLRNHRCFFYSVFYYTKMIVRVTFA